MNNRQRTHGGLLLAALLSCVAAGGTGAADFSAGTRIGGYALVSKRLVTRYEYEYTFRAAATWQGAGSLSGVSATLSAPLPAGLTALDGDLAFGDLASGVGHASQDTFRFRLDRRNELRPQDLVWQVTGTPVIASSGTIRGNVADTQGRRIAQAEVRLGDSANGVQSDEQGEFSTAFGAGDVTSDGQILVNASATGYVQTQAKVTLGSEHSNDVNLILKPVGAVQQLADPGEAAAALSLPGVATLAIGAGSVLDETAVPVTEPLQVRLTALDPTDPQERSVFPGGDFLAVDPSNPGAGSQPIGLESVVLAEVRLVGASGTEYSRLATPATLTLAIPAGLQDRYIVGDSIPLWFYDSLTGLWQREGDTQVFAQPDGTKWVRAQVSHFSWWNADEPIENQACLRLRPQNAAGGAALTDKTFYFDGVSYTGRSRGTWSGTEVGVNGKLDTAASETGHLLIETGGALYYLSRDGADPGLYHLAASPPATPYLALPTVQGTYAVDPANCTDLGVLRVDLTPPANSPPHVQINHPGAVSCGDTITITAEVSDLDGNLPPAPVANWTTDGCGTILSQSLAALTIQWKSEPGDCTVTLSTTDLAGEPGTGATTIDCSPIDPCAGDPCCMNPGDPCCQDPNGPCCTDPGGVCCQDPNSPCCLDPGGQECVCGGDPCCIDPCSCDPCCGNPGDPCCQDPSSPCCLDPGGQECVCGGDPCCIDPCSCDPCSCYPWLCDPCYDDPCCGDPCCGDPCCGDPWCGGPSPDEISDPGAATRYPAAP